MIIITGRISANVKLRYKHCCFSLVFVGLAKRWFPLKVQHVLFLVYLKDKSCKYFDGHLYPLSSLVSCMVNHRWVSLQESEVKLRANNFPTVAGLSYLEFWELRPSFAKSECYSLYLFTLTIYFYINVSGFRICDAIYCCTSISSSFSFADTW